MSTKMKIFKCVSCESVFETHYEDLWYCDNCGAHLFLDEQITYEAEFTVFEFSSNLNEFAENYCNEFLTITQLKNVYNVLSYNGLDVIITFNDDGTILSMKLKK